MTLPAVPRLLEGIHMIARTWLLVGPGATRLLASTGGEVIRSEPTAPARVDMARYVPPFIQKIPGPSADPYATDDTLDEKFDRTDYYLNNYPGKRGVRLKRSMAPWASMGKRWCGYMPPGCCDD